MSSKKLTPTVERWTYILRTLMEYRGYGSAEKLEAAFTPRRLSRMDIRRLADGTHKYLGSDKGDFKLARLSGMLDLPPETLRLTYHGNVDELAALDFDRPDGGEIKQFILTQLSPDRKRR